MTKFFDVLTFSKKILKNNKLVDKFSIFFRFQNALATSIFDLGKEKWKPIFGITGHFLNTRVKTPKIPLLLHVYQQIFPEIFQKWKHYRDLFQNR